MYTVGYLCGVFLLCVALFLLSRLGGLWHGEPTKLDQRLKSGAADPASTEVAVTRAYIRVIPTVAILGTGIYATVLLLPLVDAKSTGGSVAVGVLFTLCVALGVLAPSVMLLNRPKFAVPPHLRQEPGFVRDRINRH